MTERHPQASSVGGAWLTHANWLVRGTAAVAGLLTAAAIAGAPTLSAQSGQAPILARTQILITSGGLVINPSHQVVPRNTATLITTAVSTGNPEDPAEAPAGLPQDALVMAELIGPAFGAAIQLAARPGEPFHIQPLPLAGLYYLRNIRLESAGATLMTADPDTVSLEVINELLVSQVTSRALTAQEIRDKGIVVDQANFQVVKFTAAFGLQDRQVVLDLPMIVPRTNDGSGAFTSVPALSLPMLQPAMTPAPSIDLPKLVDAFQTPNVSIAGLLLKVEDDEIDRGFQLPPIPGVIVIPGNIAYLNQFFSVMLLVSNVAPGGSSLVVRDVRAEILLPPGDDTVAGSGDDPLRMARLGNPPVEQSRAQGVIQPGPDGVVGTADDVVTIAPQESGRSEHLVEGLREGVHTVEMKISATLAGLPIGPVPVSGRVRGTVEVRNPTFALTLSHPATVSAGEEYDLKVTVTNTSASPANFVSLNLLPRSIAGAMLVSSPSVPIDTIGAGDAQTATFRLRAQISGTVSATSFSSEGVPGRFELNTAVGALGIPMSPNTLVLPKTTAALPAALRDAALSLLGQAFALATSPVTPAGRLPLTQQIVYGRSTELAQAGQRAGLGEPLPPVATDLLLDWVGNNYAALAATVGDPVARARQQQDFAAFDDLFRVSNRGQAVVEVLGAVLSEAIQASGGRALFDSWAAAAASRAPQLTAFATGTGGTSPVALTLTDPQGRRVGIDEASGGTVRAVPFATTVPFASGGGALGQAIVDASPNDGAYRLEGLAAAAGTFDLGVLVPETSGPRKLLFADVAVPRGARIALALNVGGSPGSYMLQIDDDGNGTVDREIAPAASTVVAKPAVGVVSATQIVADQVPSSKYGQLISVLFNQPIDPASAQDGITSGRITAFQVDGNQVVGVAVQPGGRVVFLSLRDGIGPLVPRVLHVSGVRTTTGLPQDPAVADVPIVPEASLAGGTIAGKVLHGDGTPVGSAQIRLAVRLIDGDVTLSVKNTDAAGAFTFDYVPALPVQIDAVDPQTGERGDIRSTISRNAQHLDLDVILLGTGSLVGRALSPAGAPLAQAVVRVSSLTRFGDVYSAQTNDSGAFVISGIAVGNVTIEAGHLATNARVTLASAIPRAGAVVTQDLVLLPAAQVAQQTGSLSGQIYRADGVTPAPGVPVFTDRGNVTTTDASGSYRLESVPAGQVIIRAIDQPHFEQGTVVTTVVATASVTANLRMTGGFGSILGVVLDADGTPVANVVVGGGSALVRTSATGEFLLSDVPLGTRTITALDEARQLTGSAAATLSIAGEQVRIQVALNSKGSIAGRVFESDGVTPVAGVKVYLLGGQNISTVSDASGGYRFDQITVGTYQVSAFRPDFSDGNIVSTKVTFRGEVRITNVVFRGHGRVTGTMVAADGVTGLLATVAITELQVRVAQLKPPDNLFCLDNAQVGDITIQFPKCEPVGIGFISMPVNRTASTNVTTGRFAFDDVFVGPVTVQGGNALVGVTSAGGTIAAPGETLDLTMRATATSAAGGVVFLPDGRPAGADVVVTYNGANVVTDATGHYLHALVSPGGFQLTARDPATGFVAQAFGSVAAGMTADVPIRLLGRGRVTVMVTGSNGPVANAQVHLASGAYPYVTRDATADGQGRVVFDGGDAVTEGPFSVSATDPVTGAVGSAGGTIPAADASVDITITLSDEVGSVSGHLYGPDGTTTISNAQVKLSATGGDAFTSTDAAGAYRFDGVRRGHVALEAFDARTARRGRAQGDIVSNHQDVTIDIVEVPQGTVRGVVRLSTDSSPIGGAPVTVSSQSVFGGQFQTTTGPDGAFSTPGVSAGSVTVAASDPTRGLSGTATGTLTTEGEEVVVDVVLQVPARGSLRGHVLTATGAVAFGAQIIINGSLHTTVDNDGLYTFDNVPAGDISVMALAAAGSDAGQSRGRIAYDGDSATIDVRLVGTGSVTGVVQSAGGNPVSFARVGLSGRNVIGRPVGGETQTDAQGRFRFDDVLVGEVSVTAVQTGTGLAGSASGQIGVADPTTDLVVTLQPAGLAFGRVARAAGTAAAGMSLELTGPAHRFGSTSSDGRFTFADLPLGTYTLAVVDPVGSGVVSARVVVDSQGQSVDVGTLVLDEAPPTVVGIVPSNGASSVPVGQPVQVVFSEAVDVSTVNAGTLLVGSSAGSIAGSWSLSADGRTAQFTPVTRFGDFAQITVKATTGVRDLVGKALAAETVSAFTTADSTPPSVVSLTPAANAVGVLPGSVVRVAYSEAVDPAAFAGAAIGVLQGGVAVPGRVDFAFSNTVAIFTPLTPLAPNGSYDVVVAPAADIFGNRQPQTLTSHFQTIDTIAPTVQRLILPAGDVFDGSVLNVTADLGTAADVATVEFLVNGQPMRTDSAAPFDFALPVNLSLSPSFDLGARATDTSGNVGALTHVSVMVRTDQPPAVTIVSPADGALVQSGSVLIVRVHSTDDRGVSRLSLQGSGAVSVLTAVPLSPPALAHDDTFNIDVPAGTAPGDLTLRVVATDTAGATSPTAAVLLKIADTTAPSVRLLSPAVDQKLGSGTAVTFEVEAIDDVAIASVSLSSTGVVVSDVTRTIVPATPVARASFSIAIPASATPADQLSITLTALDSSGNAAPPVRMTFAIRGPIGTVRGVVRSAAGTPLGGLGVTAAGSDAAQTTTAADGTYGFDLVPGHYVVTASRPSSQGSAVSASVDVDVTVATTTTADISLPRTASIAGAVTRPEGAAAPGAPVHLNGPGVNRSTVADATGHFLLADIPDGTYVLAASDDASRSAASVPVTVSGVDQTRDLALAPLFFRVSAARSGTGTGIVSSTPAGINCGSDCEEDISTGTTVRLSAIPAPGSVFAAWSGDCSGFAECVVVADRVRRVTAQFDLAPAGVCVAPASGRVAFWPGDGDSADIVAGHDGQLVGDARFVEGRVHQAFGFSGSGAVAIPDTPVFNPQRQLSIDAWINPTAASVAYPIIVNKETASFSSFDDIQYQLAISPGGTLWFAVGGVSAKANGLPANGEGWTDGGGPIPFNQWSHVALTVDLDNGFARTYINGTLVREYAVSTALTISQRNGDLRIGNRKLAAGAFTGAIDEVAFYGRSLTAGEVRAIFDAGDRGQCKGTVFDPGIGLAATNPNGVWTFGAAATAGSLTPYTVVDTIGALTRWHVAPGIAEAAAAPNVLHNGTGTAYPDTFGAWPPGQLGLQPGSGEFSVVRFTAPASANYTIEARFSGGDAATADVHVARNTDLLFSGVVGGKGDTQTFSATIALARGETIDFLVGAGGNGAANDTMFLSAAIATPNPLLTVTALGTGSGTVTSSPAGIDCGADCRTLYVPDTVVSLTAVPAPGSSFVEFGGACAGRTADCTVTMTGPRRVSATFRSDGSGPDTDGDGLPDREEAARGTDPARADSDNDGVSDAIEVGFGSDPLDAASVPLFKRWAAGDAAAPTNWFAASNWLPAGVPTAAENVLVPRGVAAYPVLSGPAAAASIVVETGAEIQVGAFRLTATGNLFALGRIVGTGDVEAAGNDALVRGNLPSLWGSGHITFGGKTEITGLVTVLGRFDVAGQAVHIAGSLRMPCSPCSGQLRMSTTGGLLTVDQDVSIDGLDTSAVLTAGDLHIGGNLFVGGSATANFAASGTHTTFFDGLAAQTITFCCGVGPASRHFGHLVIANAAGVSLNGDAYVAGDATVRAGSILGGGGTLLVAGTLTTEATSQLTSGGVNVAGVLNANGLFSPTTTTFSGQSQVIPGGLGYRNVTVTGSARFGGPATLQGNVLLTGAADLNGQAVHVTGSLTIPCSPCSGQLRMTSPSGVLTVDHDVSVDGLDTSAVLTAGELHIGGNLFVGGSNNANFAASGTHTTVFDGGAPQTITFCCGVGPASRHFGHLVIANAAGVSFSSDLYALGNVAVRGGGSVTGTGTLSVAGDVTTEAGTVVTPRGLAIAGTLSASGTFAPETTTFTGQGQAIPGGLGYRNVTVSGTAHLAGAATMDGTLLLTGPFDLAGQRLHVTGNLTIPCGPCTGQLRMTDAGGVLTVDRDAVFDGTSTEGALTRGELHVAGNFFVGGSTGLNFAATEDHTVVFDGSVQSIQFCCGVGPGSRRFANVRITGGTTITMQSDLFASGPLTVQPVGTARPTVLGNGRLFTVSGASVQGAVFDNVGLVLNQGTGLSVNDAVFRNYPPSATQLTVNAAALSATFSGLEFLSAPGTSGAYIRGTDTDGPSTLAELTIADSRPRHGMPRAISANGFLFHWGTATDDTDGDGLTDADELQLHHTNPLLADTDGDGVSDADEVSGGSNPLVSEVCALPPNGIVSWWRAENDAGDAVGGRNGALLNGVTFVPGRVGSAFHFDGASAVVDAAADGLPVGSAPRTVEFWMRPQSNARVPFMYGAPAPSDGFYPLVSGSVACIGQWGGGALEVCGTTTVTDGAWHHLAMTYDGVNTVSLFVDGGLEATVPKAYSTTAGGIVRIGGALASASDLFRGDLDEVAVYSRALDQSEIQLLVLASRAGKCPDVVADARHQFSTLANPNGSWTYGASPTLGQIVPFTRVEGQAWRGAPGIAEGLGAPTVALIPSGALAFHPGPADDFAVIRWTAAQAGSYQIDTTFSAGDSTTTDVHVVVNGRSVFDGAIVGFGDRRTFRGVVSLAAGDTVDFAVGSGGNSFYYDTTLIEARISRALPPP